MTQVGHDPGAMHHACVGLGSNQENRAVGNRGQARNDIVECGTFLLRDT
jgi:hypothetical protein